MTICHFSKIFKCFMACWRHAILYLSKLRHLNCLTFFWWPTGCHQFSIDHITLMTAQFANFRSWCIRVICLLTRERLCWTICDSQNGFKLLCLIKIRYKVSVVYFSNKSSKDNVPMKTFKEVHSAYKHILPNIILNFNVLFALWRQFSMICFTKQFLLK